MTVVCQHVTAVCQRVTAVCQPVTAVCQPVTAVCQPVIAVCQRVTAVCQPVTAVCQPVTAVCQPVSVVCDCCLCVQVPAAALERVSLRWSSSSSSRRCFKRSDSSFLTGPRLPASNLLSASTCLPRSTLCAPLCGERRPPWPARAPRGSVVVCSAVHIHWYSVCYNHMRTELLRSRRISCTYIVTALPQVLQAF